jgi:DNA-binding MarR family transcriptional regulator
MINPASTTCRSSRYPSLGRNLKAMSDSDSLQRSLAGLELALSGHRRDVRRRLRVSDEELTVLLHLAHDGGARQPRLAALTGLSRSGTGALVQRLEQAGLVERRTDPSDRRLRRVELTSAGRTHLQDARRGLNDAIAKLTKTSDPEAVASVERLQNELAAELDALAAEPRAAAPAYETELDPVWRRWA